MRKAGINDQVINKVLSLVVQSSAPATTQPPAQAPAPATTPAALPATQKSSTGGTIQKTSTGLVHTANPNNPNMAYKESYIKYVLESWNEYKLDEGIGSAIGGALGKGIGAVKNVGTAIASPFRDAAAGYRGGKINAQVGAIADKAYRAWSTYRQQLDKSAPTGKADPAMVEKQLLAFVSQNLLKGKTLSTLINKDQILGLVKQIATTTPSSTGGTTTATSTGLVHTANPANPNQPQPAATPAKPATAPGVGVFGQMSGQLGAKPVVKPATTAKPATTPATKRTKVKTPSTPGGAPATFGGQKLDPNDPNNANLFKAINAATKKPPAVNEAAGPELELFKKLVTLTAQAQAEVDPNAPPPVQGQPLGGKDARSTGNAAADKVLAQQGFAVR
jgi:hypothetical protein